MSDQYVGEIRMFAGNYAPQGWAFCNGALLPINGNDALYSVLGTTYGGDGRTNFALPDLRGRIPISRGTLEGTSYGLGSMGGTEKVTLEESQLPAHTHIAKAGTAAPVSSPANAYWGKTTGIANYLAGGTPNVQMSQSLISVEGGNQAHDNVMPSFAVSFIIALNGIYPTPQ